MHDGRRWPAMAARLGNPWQPTCWLGARWVEDLTQHPTPRISEDPCSQLLNGPECTWPSALTTTTRMISGLLPDRVNLTDLHLRQQTPSRGHAGPFWANAHGCESKKAGKGWKRCLSLPRLRQRVLACESNTHAASLRVPKERCVRSVSARGDGKRRHRSRCIAPP